MKRVFQLIFLIIICSIQANAQILSVPSQYTSIQAAIDAASEGDTVLVAEGPYMENLNMRGKGITLASQFLLDEDPAHITATIIDGSSPSNTDTASVIYVPKGSGKPAVICGLTITGGKGTLTLREIIGDVIRSGGGIFIDATSCIVKHNIITGNIIENDFSRLSAAGILAREGSGIEIHILNNTISNNKLISTQAVAGAGLAIGNILNYNCKFIVENNIISGNIAQCTGQKGCSGAGIACWFGLPTLGQCKINNNLIENNQLLGYELSTYAGGILIVYTEPGGYFVDPNPVPEITNNVIRNNSANPGGGGAIGIWTDWIQHSVSSKVTPQPVIINNTVVGNISSGAKGIFNWRSFPLVMNNIFWNTNLDPVRLEELYHVPIPAYGTNDGVFYAFNNCLKNGFFPEANDVYADNVKDDPGFEPDTFILAEGSPCIAAGIDSFQAADRWYYAPLSDYYNTTRKTASCDQKIDLGAVESPYNSSDWYDTEHVINVPSCEQPTIQAAIDAASDGDTVLVAEGTYYENINFKGKAITVASWFLLDGDTSYISKTIIDGSHATNPDTASTVTMWSGEDTTSVLIGFTITGGKGTLIINPQYSKY